MFELRPRANLGKTGKPKKDLIETAKRPKIYLQSKNQPTSQKYWSKNQNLRNYVYLKLNN
jgi:hypothetical protein